MTNEIQSYPEATLVDYYIDQLAAARRAVEHCERQLTYLHELGFIATQRHLELIPDSVQG